MARVWPQRHKKIKCLYTERAALCGAPQRGRTRKLTCCLTFCLLDVGSMGAEICGR